jgi:hypothetical protein
MSYQLYITDPKNTTTPNAAMTVNTAPQKSFIFSPDNTDYQQFKIDLKNGVQLSDANNNVMTSDQVTSFLATLP